MAEINPRTQPVRYQREIDPAALALIKQFEGLSLIPYLCPAQIWTIGYGATRDKDGRQVTAQSAAITESEATDLLRRDVAQAAAWVDKLVRVPLSPRQAGALTSFIFNLGPTRFRASTLRKRLNERDFDAVPNQLLRWVYGGGRKLPGLVRRREAEAFLWVEG